MLQFALGWLRGAQPPLAVIALALLLAAACGRSSPPATSHVSHAPAARIVTLAPHLAELAFAAGAGDRLVAVVEYSDYPPDVLQLPRVGDAFRVDYEAIAGLRPDLILGWASGNPPETLRRLDDLGYRVVTVEPVQLEDIAGHLEEIARLAGTSPQGDAAAADFRRRLSGLRERFQAAVPLRVFVQLLARPYFTVTDRHFLGQGLTVCGGTNVFGSLGGLTAVVSAEAVIEAAPQVIVASDVAGQTEEEAGLAWWRQWRQLPAVRAGNLYLLDADLLSRPGVRILDGIERLCTLLETARSVRGAAAVTDARAAR